MIVDPSAAPDDPENEIAALVRTLHETQQRLQELTGGEVDAVLHPGGHSYLLHEAQEKLRQSEAAQHDLAATQTSILKALPAHIALLDHEGAILSVNEGWRHFAESNGLQNGAAGVGQNYLEICDRAHGVCAAGAPEVAVGIRAVLSGATGEFAFEYPCHSATEQRWFQLRVNPVEHDGPCGALVMHVAVTERKRAEERIAAQAALIDEAPDAIVVRDLEHRITFWSKGAERLYGWTADEVQGSVHPESLRVDAATFAEANRAVRETGRWNGEIQKYTRDGTALILDGRWTLLRDARGQPQSILSIDTDITERKQLERQFLRAQRMESIGTLAGGIAHDLNNVLSPIMMSLELLKMRFPDSDSAELLAIISTSAQRGAEMVSQVLTFARGVEGRRVEVQLGHLVHDIEKLSNDTFLKNIDVRTVIPHDLWTVLADPTQLHQVLLNLCVNARDAMPAGGLLTIAAENVTLDAHEAGLNLKAKTGPYVLLRVEDSGTGIPPAVMEKIFDPFFTTKEVGKGTGLGLSTSLAIIESHGGFIRVDSAPGRGTKFQVYLPAGNGAASATPAALPEAMPQGNGELILVVDDEMSLRLITQQTLEAFGYQVLLASDGAEAVAAFVQHKDEIAAVLTDMMMPVMDGLATIQVLRKLDARVPIIAMSGLATESHLARATSLGVTDFLAKPYPAQALLMLLRKVLSSSPPEARDAFGENAIRR